MDPARKKEYASPIIDLVQKKNILPNKPALPVFLDSGLPVVNLAKQVLEADSQLHLTGNNMVQPLLTVQVIRR